MKFVAKFFATQLALVYASWVIPSVSGSKNASEPDNAIAQLLNTTLNSSVVWDRLSEVTSKYGSRLSGSPGLENSTKWVVEHLKKDGFDVRTEPVNISYWRPDTHSLHLLNPGGRPRAIPVVPLGRSPSTPKGGVLGNIVAVRSLEEIAKLGREKVEGKIVLINEPWQGYDDTVNVRAYCGAEAGKYGALAVIIASVTPEQSPNNLHTGLTRNTSIAAVAITRHDAAELYDLYQASQKDSSKPVPRVHLGVNTILDPNPKIGYNIIADVRGRERPDEYVLVSGHLDSWFLGVGAVDDGAGAFTSWEAARAILKLSRRPKRTVRVVFWVDEEQNASGAIQYAKDHADELDRYSLAIESDYGNFEPDGITFAGSDVALKQLSSIGSHFNPRIGPYAGKVVAGDDPGRDVGYLLEKGVPSAGLVSRDPFTGGPAGRDYGYFRVHHSPDDQVSFLKPDQLARNAAALAVWAYSVAEADALLPRAPAPAPVKKA